MRQRTFGCAMTLGALAIVAAAAAATTPPTVATKRRRGVAGLRRVISGLDGPDGKGVGPFEWPEPSVSGAVLSIECSSGSGARTPYKVGHYSLFPCRDKPVKRLGGALTLFGEVGRPHPATSCR